MLSNQNYLPYINDTAAHWQYTDKNNKAARVLRVTTATRTTYGQAQARATALHILTQTWIRVLSTLPEDAGRAGVLLPTPLLCAVSWIWIGF